MFALGLGIGVVIGIIVAVLVLQEDNHATPH